MKKTWKKLMALCCAASMMMTVPGQVVLADEVETSAEEVLIDEVEMPAEDISIDEVEVPDNEDSIYEDLEEEAVGAGATNVGDGVTATFDAETGAVKLTSRDGEMWPDWVNELEVDRDEIVSIEVVSGTVYLPDETTQGRDDDDNYQMFAGLTNLTSFDLSGFDTSNVTDMNRMFEDCSSLEALDLSSFDTSSVTNTAYMFSGCSNLTEIKLSSFNTSNVTDMESMFSGCSSLAELDLGTFKTSNVSNMVTMFDGCASLASLKIGSFDTSNVESMYRLFAECQELTELDLGGFNTSNVTDMDSMFLECASLTSLDLGSFDTSNVESMYNMFSGCSSLTELAIDNFETSNVMDMAGMFQGCGSLNVLDLSNFDTSNVMDMYGMFLGCSSLRKLDLSSFDTTYVDDVSDMLYDCTGLGILETPQTNTQPIELPIEMYDESDQVYTEIPEMTESITLFTVMDLDDCEAALDPISFEYDGTAKEPTVTVNNEDIVLVEGIDYTVTYLENINAGTATAKVTAIGHNTGEKTLTFTINKANPQLSFAEAAVSKKTTDPAFTNALTKPTDVEVTFKSSNTNVASVDSTSGKVTLKGAGSATITAEASGSENYNAGSASYTLTVTAPAPTPTPKPTSGFSDVQDPKHPYYNAIYWAAEDGITKGYPDGTFGIDNNCTRGEMMMFLWRYAGKPAPKNATKSPFKDVPTNHTFFKAILWGSQKGITKGYSDGTFGINRNVTRGEAMMFLWRLKGKPAPKAAAKSPFKDVPTNHVFYKAILWGSQKKITTGYTSGVNKGKFMVNQNCSRGQIVTFLYRAK